TLYSFCAIAQNSVAKTFGSVLTFTTTAAPTVTTSAATLVTSSGATDRKSAEQGHDATTGWYRHATGALTCDDVAGTKVPAAGTALGSGGAAVSSPLAIGGLAPGTLYSFCAIAQNSVAKTFGSVLTFTTTALPTVTTSAATLVTSSGATLNGSADPNLDATTGWYRYAAGALTCDDIAGTKVPAAGTALGSGGAAVSYPHALAGLAP